MLKCEYAVAKSKHLERELGVYQGFYFCLVASDRLKKHF